MQSLFSVLQPAVARPQATPKLVTKTATKTRWQILHVVILRVVILRVVYVASIFLLTACIGTAPPPIAARVQQAPALVQPLTLADLYWARADERTSATDSEREGEEISGTALIEQGARLYTVNCAPCHQSNGEGMLNRFPALNHNALVTASSPQPLMRTVLYGRGLMPGFTSTLTDPELAAVLSYIRQAWSNAAAPITAADLRQVRSESVATR